MSEVNDFFKEIKPAEDVLEQPIVIEKQEEEEEERPKNRRERRLMDRLARRGDEANTYAAENAALKAVIAAQGVAKSTEEADFLKMLEPIYGTSEPGKAQATELLKKAFSGMKEVAKREFLEEMERREAEQSSKASAEEKKELDTLDTIEEFLEDEHGADFSDEATREGFYTLLEKLSPKDKDGDIIEYADPEMVYEIFKKSRTQTSSRAKETASRSMTRSGAPVETKLEDQRVQDYLKENGIIF